MIFRKDTIFQIGYDNVIVVRNVAGLARYVNQPFVYFNYVILFLVSFYTLVVTL